MRKPDFFVVGHPRCGSGVVDMALSAHPDVFMAPKELHFFGSDLAYNRPARSSERYLAEFSRARDHRRLGESSTWYLHSSRAAEEMAEFAPDARIIVLLREPVSWLASLHGHFLFTGDETITDLAEAIDCIDDHRPGRRPPSSLQPAGALAYRSLVAYSRQIERYYDAFGREQVRVVLLDDLSRDAAAVFDGLYEFLGLERPSSVVEVGRRARNGHRVVRSKAVRWMLRQPFNRAVLKHLQGAPPGWLLALRAARRMNIRYRDRAPLPHDLRRRLSQDFRAEVRATARLIGRDLSDWDLQGTE